MGPYPEAQETAGKPVGIGVPDAFPMMDAIGCDGLVSDF
jgi:hypothetical protein